MLALEPATVLFGQTPLDNVRAVAIDRAAEHAAVEWGDLGPHAAFADVPRQKITVRLVRDLVRGELSGPAPGQLDTLSFYTAPVASFGGRRKVSIAAMVTGVKHELGGRSGAAVAQQVITLIAVSADGAADPVSITPAEHASD